jgi:hypothetical protein
MGTEGDKEERQPNKTATHLSRPPTFSILVIHYITPSQRPMLSQSQTSMGAVAH